MKDGNSSCTLSVRSVDNFTKAIGCLGHAKRSMEGTVRFVNLPMHPLMELGAIVENTLTKMPCVTVRMCHEDPHQEIVKLMEQLLNTQVVSTVSMKMD